MKWKEQMQRLHDHLSPPQRCLIEAAYRRGCHQVISMLFQWVAAGKIPLSTSALARLEETLCAMRDAKTCYPLYLHTAPDRVHPRNGRGRP